MRPFNRLLKRTGLTAGFGIGLVATVAQAVLVEETGKDANVSPVPPGESREANKILTFQEVDKNGDGYVSRDELNGMPALLKHFERADADKDGRLQENEYKNLIMDYEK